MPAENWSDKTQADKIRERIKQRRVKREQESKLLSLRKLGESDSEEEGGADRATSWVEKQKAALKAKQEAAKRAKMLEELDDEFGVGSIVEEEAKREREKAYDRAELSGIKVRRKLSHSREKKTSRRPTFQVEHDASHFKEGQSVILTLKDSDVLADEEGANSTLVNVNMADDDRTRKRLDDAKKARVGYNAYDMEEVSTGVLEQRGFLELLFFKKKGLA